MNILDALDDPKVFGGFFRDTDTWHTWRVFLAALFGLPMSEEQLEIYRQFTGRSTAPTESSHEAWLVCGRRAGKSFVLATIAVFLAAFKDWRPPAARTALITRRARMTTSPTPFPAPCSLRTLLRPPCGATGPS
jgi:hypothetical protein